MSHMKTSKEKNKKRVFMNSSRLKFRFLILLCFLSLAGIQGMDNYRLGVFSYF